MQYFKNALKKICLATIIAGSMIGCEKEPVYVKGKVFEKSDRKESDGKEYVMLQVETKNEERYVVYVHGRCKPLEMVKDAVSVGSKVKFRTDNYTSKWEYTHVGKKAHTISLFSDDIDVVPDTRSDLEKFIDADY